MTVENQEKSNATLFFKLPHKFYLVRMNILQGKSIHGTFLGIKAYRDSLHGTDVVYGTLLFEKSQCDLPAVFIHFDGGNRSRNLLYQRQSGLRVFFIGTVDHVFQCGSPKSSCIPCCHLLGLLSNRHCQEPDSEPVRFLQIYGEVVR